MLATVAHPRLTLGLQTTLPNPTVNALLQHRLGTNTFNHHFHTAWATADAQRQGTLRLNLTGDVLHQPIESPHVGSREASHQHKGRQLGRRKSHTRAELPQTMGGSYRSNLDPTSPQQRELTSGSGGR